MAILCVVYHGVDGCFFFTDLFSFKIVYQFMGNRRAESYLRDHCGVVDKWRDFYPLYVCIQRKKIQKDPIKNEAE